MAGVARQFPFELVHAHYAVPAGDAARRAAPDARLVVSVHGHDVHGARMPAVSATLAHARLVLANSAGTARRCAAAGSLNTRVVHLGADVPAIPPERPRHPTLVTVGNLVARKRHGDVITALAALTERHPDLRYEIVGDGPERDSLRTLAASLGVGGRVVFRGRLGHEDAVRTAQAASLFVLPSVDEAFGVAYIEAMAGGVAAIGCTGEDGPAEIAAAGPGIELVPPGDAGALAGAIDSLLSDPARMREIGDGARSTVERSFTWERCGAATVEAYEDALA
jgi:glycosyltransferase involved in cell wall biosynthesis